MIDATGRSVYHLTAGEPVADGVRAVATSQLDKALEDLDHEDDLHEAVHEVRKRCKKVRALVRLVRDGVPDTYDHVNTTLRDAARLVSDERDAAAAVETHDALVDALGEETLEPFAVVRDRLVERRDGEVLESIEAQLPEVRSRIADLRVEVNTWELPEGHAIDVLQAGYGRTYGRARDRWTEATDDPSSHVWHQWRKRVKYHRHHVDLLREAWEPVMLHREDLLHDMTDVLGDDHDLAELRDALLAGAVELDEDVLTGYVGLLDARRTELQHEGLPLAGRLFTEPVEEHGERVFSWWRRAVEDADAAVEAITDLDEHTPVIPHGR